MPIDVEKNVFLVLIINFAKIINISDYRLAILYIIIHNFISFYLFIRLIVYSHTQYALYLKKMIYICRNIMKNY